MFRRTTLAMGLIGLAVPAFAQQPPDVPAAEGLPETVETLATEAEAASVRETLAMIGCEAEVIEKENEDLFEVDDAQCEVGQYDVKLDGDFSIISVTRD